MRTLLISPPRALRSLALALLLGLSTLASPAAGEPVRPLPPDANPPNAGELVLPGIWRLAGTDPALPIDDLAPLRKLIGNAEVVALGESVHTSGGFYEMKHRLFRYLVEEMGFRAFAIESPWTPADRVARYVETCDGSAGDAIDQGLWTTVWHSVEVRNLVEWMCEWNRIHPDEKDRVHFYGFDIQLTSGLDGPPLIAFLRRIGFAADDPRILGLRQCEGVGVLYYPSQLIPPAVHQECMAAVDALSVLFDENEKEIVRQTSKEDLGWARVRLTAIRAWEEEWFYIQDFRRSYAARDLGMADVFQAIRELRFPKAKTVLWAHNGHVANGHPFGHTALGDHLDERLGKDYVSLGLVAYDPYIDWAGVGCRRMNYAGPNSVETFLHELGEGFLLIDIRFPGAETPFFEPGRIYNVGEGRIGVPADNFDGLVYLDVSPKMTPTLWPSCQ